MGLHSWALLNGAPFNSQFSFPGKTAWALESEQLDHKTTTFTTDTGRQTADPGPWTPTLRWGAMTQGQDRSSIQNEDVLLHPE